MNNKIALESLAMDLKRVALGCQRNSLKMAENFYKEALKRKDEIDERELQPYLQKILQNIDTLADLSPKRADDALMLSILVQNYTQKFLQ